MPPASRVGDMHVCPMVTGIVPHVGGPVLPAGCPTVLIGGMPAARVGDMCVCVGPPDVIAKGSPTVMIGGMMAARIGDLTAHGGVLVMGMPTVMIGEMGMGGAVPPVLAGLTAAIGGGGMSLASLGSQISSLVASAGSAASGLSALSVLGKLWTLPNTLLGLVIGGIGHVLQEAWYQLSALGEWMGLGPNNAANPDIIFGNNGIQFINNAFGIGDGETVGAITLGNVIIYGPGAYPQLADHEKQHTYQAELLGPLYLPAYVLGMGIALAQGEDPFGPANPMETGPSSHPARPNP